MAISDFDRVINLTNDNARAYYSRGINQKALGNTKEAKTNEQALQLANQQGNGILYNQTLKALENL